MNTQAEAESVSFFSLILRTSAGPSRSPDLNPIQHISDEQRARFYLGAVLDLTYAFVAGWEQIPAARLQNPLQKASQKRGGCSVLTPMESHFNYQLKMPRCLCREMIKVGVQLASWVEQSGAACCRSLCTKVSFVFRFVLRPPGALRGHGSSCVPQWIFDSPHFGGET